MTPPHGERPANLNHVFTPNWLELSDGWRRLALATWIVAVAGVTTFSLLPAFAPPGEYGFDKMIHTAGYVSLALLPHAAFKSRKAALMAAFTMIPLGCAIELAQAFVPGRYSDFWDAIANSCGVLVGMALGARFRRIVSAMTRVAR